MENKTATVFLTTDDKDKVVYFVGRDKSSADGEIERISESYESYDKAHEAVIKYNNSLPIINKAAQVAYEKYANDPDMDFATVDFFIEDYTRALLSGNQNDLVFLYFAVASLDLQEEAQLLTGLTEATAMLLYHE